MGKVDFRFAEGSGRKPGEKGLPELSSLRVMEAASVSDVGEHPAGFMPDRKFRQMANHDPG